MQNIHYFKENPPKSWWRPIVATFLVFALCGGVGSIPISILISIFTKEPLSQVTENSISGELEKMGYIYRRHGKGTYVSDLSKKANNITRLI